MNLAAIFVRRPVLAAMVVLFLVVLGIFCYRKLGIDQLPNVDLPVVTVVTTLRGASPEEMEAQVTKPIEEAVNAASAIQEVRSTTLEGISTVVVTFELERKTADAVQDVRDKVAGVLAMLPEGTDPPIITRFDTSAIPVATVVVSGSRSLREITEFADKVVKEDLETITGVGQAFLVGGQHRAVNVWLDASKMSAYGISVLEARQALTTQNVEIPTGRVQRSDSEAVLRTVARAQTVPEFEELVVTTANGTPITLGDIGRAEDGIEEPRSLSRYDGRNAVAIIVQKQSGTNTVEVVDRLQEHLDALADRLPSGMRVQIARDGSAFIRRSIGELKFHLVLGGVLASLVVLLFMGNVRSTLIAAIAIPTSLVATFTAMVVLGFTLNNFTLLGLVLAVGIVIDDAIVVLESIYRHIDELHKDPVEAAIDGTREIMLAVVATTFSLMVIFLPIAFMAGRVGRFFHSFGLTVAAAIAFSLVIAITLTPMLCSRLLRRRKAGLEPRRTLIDRVLHRGYEALLYFSMRRKWVVVVIALACLAAVPSLFRSLGKDFIPQDDRGEFNISIQARPGTTLEGTDRLMRAIEGKIRRIPHVDHILTTIGDTGNGNDDVTLCTLWVRLAPLSRRGAAFSQAVLMKKAREVLATVPDIRAAVQTVSDVQQGGGASAFQFNYAIQGPDLAHLDQIANQIMTGMRGVRGLVDVDTATALRKPELRLTIDRRKAADLGIRAADIATSLRTLVAGEPVTKFREGSEQYDVWLRVRPEDRASEESLARLEVRSSRGALVKLDNLVQFRSDTGPSQIDRLDRQRQVTLVANLDGIALGDANDSVKALAAATDMPPGYRGATLGRAKVLGETTANFTIAFGLSLVFMYMILAAQFESLLHPVTIMLSLPLSIPFALVSLVLLGETLNLYSVIGMFMLFGIIKKNGILQVDYTNTLRERGLARDEAIHQANMVRLRPILMTTVTLVAGMIPIALGQGPGASSRASMAKVIIGGQVLSLVITLLIVPVGYALFDDATRFLRQTLPEGWRARRAWAFAVAGSGGCAAGSLAVTVTAAILGDVPPAVPLIARGLGLGALGLLLGGLGIRALSRPLGAMRAGTAGQAPR